MNRRFLVPLSHRRGFTLIELLVVISVIAILGSITVGAIFTAMKTAKKRAAQTKCDQIAKGVLNLLTSNNAFGSPLLERAGSLKTNDPFTLADQFWIDWELNPENQRWYNRLSVSGSPYFPKLNQSFKRGTDPSKRGEISSYVFKNYVEFTNREIIDHSDYGNNPRGVDPWALHPYKYVCYYQTGLGSGFLVDGVVSYGADGLIDFPGPTPYSPGDNPYVTSDAATPNADNTWTEIGKYPR